MPPKLSFCTKVFKYGFDLKFMGNRRVRYRAKNLKLRVGSETDLWNKLIKEVQTGRVAGPFLHPPFDHYIQSPIGLVPKDGGTKTRLIFHLSHPRADPSKSVNGSVPKEFTEVTYPEFDHAVQLCMEAGQGCAAAKSDLTSAFRHLCIRCPGLDVISDEGQVSS